MKEKRHRRLKDFIASLYFSFGLALSQFFHTLKFQMAMFPEIRGFPDYPVPPKIAFIETPFLLLGSSIVGLAILSPMKKRPFSVFVYFLCFELLSQAIGRGLIKFGLDLFLAVILCGYFVIENRYRHLFDQHTVSNYFKLMHSELTTLFQTSISISIFFVSVLGISFATSFLTQYYKENSRLIQGFMFWYGAMVIYIGIGFALFWSKNLYDKFTYARNSYISLIEEIKSSASEANDA